MDPCKPEPAVVIVGAGISGLSAAQRLAQSGISNFTVLEATDRYTDLSFDVTSTNRNVLLHSVHKNVWEKTMTVGSAKSFP